MKFHLGTSFSWKHGWLQEMRLAEHHSLNCKYALCKCTRIGSSCWPQKPSLINKCLHRGSSRVVTWCCLLEALCFHFNPHHHDDFTKNRRNTQLMFGAQQNVTKPSCIVAPFATYNNPRCKVCIRHQRSVDGWNCSKASKGPSRGVLTVHGVPDHLAKRSIAMLRGHTNIEHDDHIWFFVLVVLLTETNTTIKFKRPFWGMNNIENLIAKQSSVSQVPWWHSIGQKSR